MPNHITNWVEIKGSEAQITKLKKATIKQAKDDSPNEVEFDFNGIIKMPEEVARTGSGSHNATVKTQAEADKLNEKARSPHDGNVDTWAITEAEHARRMTEYGATNWYDWSCKHWGTKWGAYSVDIIHQSKTKLVLSFQTAWSPPEPIFDKLTDDGFEVNCFWQDEDPSNEGTYGEPYDAFDIDHQVTVDYIGADDEV